jgi:hypothetical protein
MAPARALFAALVTHCNMFPETLTAGYKLLVVWNYGSAIVLLT